MILHVLNMKAGEQRQPAYISNQPLGQGWPVTAHGEAMVTEQVAIYIISPTCWKPGCTALDDPDRGPIPARITYGPPSSRPDR